MNLQPLYDIKERLEYAAVSGTGLLGEDFRLRRAAEGFASLAAASPVFAKIHSGLQALLCAPAQERAGCLLDLLALVDAVAYTQAHVGLAGDLEPLPVGDGGTYLPIAYGQLQPLIAALTGTGGGRMELVQSVWEAHPEYFTDFRVLPALVSGLGDSYNEMADWNAEVLKKLGVRSVPLLKKGFDPAGKRDMVRRVEILAHLEGAAAAPWLRAVLPEAKKEVRAAVILALGAGAENASLLLDLSKSERGKNREAVLQALALQEGPEVQAFWAAELEKRVDAVWYLGDAHSDWASNLAAAVFRKQVETVLTGEGRISQEMEETLRCCRCAALGKTSPAMLDFWRWADEQLPAIQKLKNAPGQQFRLDNELADWLLESLCQAGTGPLCGLCLELWEKHRETPRYLPHALLAALLTRPAAEVYGAFSPYVLTAKPLLGGERKKGFHQAVRQAFSYICWKQEEGCYETFNGYDGSRGVRHPLFEPLDLRWYDLLIKGKDMGDILRSLFRPDHPEICAKVGKYFYMLIHESSAAFIEEDIALLRQCGWTEWKGLLSKRVKRSGDMSVYTVIRLLEKTPLTGPEKAAELRELESIVKERHAATSRPLWPALAVQNQVARWEAE